MTGRRAESSASSLGLQEASFRSPLVTIVDTADLMTFVDRERQHSTTNGGFSSLNVESECLSGLTTTSVPDGPYSHWAERMFPDGTCGGEGYNYWVNPSSA